MSREHVELIAALQDAWNRGEAIDPADYFHPQVEFLPLRAATEGAYHGLGGMERFIADTDQVFEKFEMRNQFEDLGERVLAWGRIHVRARGSGVETDVEVGGILEYRDGRISRWEDFGSREKALAALRGGVDDADDTAAGREVDRRLAET